MKTKVPKRVLHLFKRLKWVKQVSLDGVVIYKRKGAKRGKR